MGNGATKKKKKKSEKHNKKDGGVPLVYNVMLAGGLLSGRTTFMKHVHLLFDDRGFYKTDLLEFKRIIFSNVLEAMWKLLEDVAKDDEMTTSTTSPSLKKRAELHVWLRDHISALRVELGQDVSQTSDEWIRALEMFDDFWRHEEQQTVLRDKLLSTDYRRLDGLDYFLDSIGERLLRRDYLPTADDVVRARMRSTGTWEELIDLNHRNLVHRPHPRAHSHPHPVLNFVDARGSRASRRKWVHYLQSAAVILYCVDLSEYDLSLFEDRTCNAMRESLETFKYEVNLPYLQPVPIVLLFNKLDRLRVKIQRGMDPSRCFPDYDGGLNVEKVSIQKL